jgi:DNA-binding transcriptional regulator YiaG
LTPAEVRAARAALGLTQTGLADLLGRRARAVQWWEQDDAPDKQRIPADTALLLQYMVRYGLPDVALKARRK